MSEINFHKMCIVMECYDKLPQDLREWIASLHFSLHDDHILRGVEEVKRCKKSVEANEPTIYKGGNGQN